MARQRFTLDRRAVLRGGATTLALPALDIMFNSNGNALAQGGPIPRRLGVFFWGNGVRPDQWRPQGTGTNWTPSEELQPLAHLQSYISVMSNCRVPISGTAHHVGRGAILSGAYDPAGGMYGYVDGPSLDQVAAKHWQGKTPIRSLELGLSMRSKGGVNASRASGSTSWSGRNTAIPAEFSPSALFTRLFGGGLSQNKDAVRDRRIRESILDTVKQDATALKRRLGKVDSDRLDAHLDGIRSLEMALATADKACALPDKPTDPVVNLGHELLTERNELMSRVLAKALACDLTRAFSYEYAGMQADTIFWQVGATEGWHVMTHDDRNLPQVLQPQYERVHGSVVFVMGHLAYLLDRLREIPEGDGNLLDNMCIQACSEVNDGTKHSYDSMPLLVIGKAGGALRGGVHYVSPNFEICSRVSLTCLRAVGVPVDSFGAGPLRASTTISAIET